MAFQTHFSFPVFRAAHYYFSFKFFYLSAKFESFSFWLYVCVQLYKYWNGSQFFCQKMGRLFIESLPGPKIFRCKCCKVDSASPENMVSKNFFGRFGKAYLFKTVYVSLNLPFKFSFMIIRFCSYSIDHVIALILMEKKYNLCSFCLCWWVLL